MNYTLEELKTEYDRLKGIIEQNKQIMNAWENDIERLEQIRQIIDMNRGISDSIRNYNQRVEDAKRVNINSDKEEEIIQNLEYIQKIINSSSTNMQEEIDTPEQEIEFVDKIISEYKKQMQKEKEKIENENEKQNNLLDNLKKVCQEKQDVLRNLDEKEKINNSNLYLESREIIEQTKKIEKELDSIYEYKFFTQEQLEQIEKLKEEQKKLTERFNTIINNENLNNIGISAEIKSSAEMIKERINKKISDENENTLEEQRKVEELIRKIDDSKKEINKGEQIDNIIQSQSNKEENINEVLEAILREPPKEEKTLSQYKEEYQKVLDEIKMMKQNNFGVIFDIEKYDELIQKKNDLEKILEKEKDKKTEPMPKFDREYFDNIISKRTNQSYYDGVDLYQNQLEDVKKLYDQEVNSEFLKAEQMLKNDKTMTLEDLRKQLSMELGKNTIDKIIDKFEKEQKIENPLTEEKFAQMQEIANNIDNELIPSTDLNENNIETENSEQINEKEDNNTLIDADERVYQRRIKENARLIDEISGNIEDNNQVLTEKPMSNYEQRKIKERERLIRQFKKEIEKKVKRKTTKEKFMELRSKIKTKIVGFLSNDLENVDELEEIKGRSR